MIDKLKLSLIENSKDFIKSAIGYAQQEESRAWKYAILNLASGIELIIKAILEKEHWSLLFENIDNASKEKLETGEFRSVDFGIAVNRLKTIIGIQISPKEDQYLKKIRNIRNRITHLSIEINLEELKSIVARGLSIYIELNKHVAEQEAADEFGYYLNTQLMDFEKFVNVRLSTLESSLESSERPTPRFLSCPDCMQNTLIIDGEDVRCRFCGMETDLKGLADSTEGHSGPCPICEGGELGFILYNNEEGELICVKCGFTADHDYNRQCDYCGEIFWNESGENFCSDCWDRIMERE